MFKDLRPNAPFYVFDKGDDMSLQVGSVASVGQPVVKPQANFNAGYQFQPEYIVDVSVKVGDDVLTFKQLPANLDIADFPSVVNPPSEVGDKGRRQSIVVASNRELIRAEIEAVLANSKAVIDSVAKHEDTVARCEGILNGLNPSLAKEREQEDKIAKLEGSIEELKKLIIAQQPKQANSNQNNNQNEKKA